LPAGASCAIVGLGKGLSPRTASATLSFPPAGGSTLTRRDTTMAMKKKSKKKKAEKKPS
jgi:hypothetical protein